jgi:hypothetical protein
MTKAGLSAEIFGARLAKQLLPAMGELREKMDAVPKAAIISDENVEKAHAFDVGLQHLETQIKATTVSLLGWITAQEKIGGLSASDRNAIRDSQHGISRGSDLQLPTGDDGAKQLISNADAIANKLNALRTQAMTPLSAAIKQQITDLHAWGEGEAEIANDVKQPVEAIHLFIEAQKKAAEYTKTWGKALENLEPVLNSPSWNGSIESALKLGGSIHDLSVYYGVSEGVIKSHKDGMDAWDKVIGVEAPRSLKELESKLNEMSGAIPEKFFADASKVSTDLYLIESGAKSSAAALEQIGVKAKPSMADLDATLTKSQRVISSIAGDLQKFPQLLISAFTGGGNLSGALNALSTTFSETLFDPAKGIFKNITSGLSNAVGGALSGTLGKTVSGLLGNTIGAILPGIGGLVGPLFEKLFSIGGPSKDELAARDTFATFQKQFGTLQQTIDAVGAAYAKAGKTGVQAQQDLQRALDATHVSAQAEAEALATINGVLDSAKKDQDDLNAAVQRYGFSIQELGPAMQKQQLDQQATQLLNDWRLLVGSGIDLATVNEHMAGSINDYLKLARATGQEVPEAMKGILQKLIDTGELTDDAGNKITDLQDTGVTFSTTMTEGFQKVVDKLQELIAKIPDLAASFASIPAINVPVNYQYNIPPPPDFGQSSGDPYASTGGLVTAAGIQHFAGGGRVLPFPSGTDTVPAMLTPGEMVLNADQQKRLLSGGGGTVIYNITIEGSVRSDKEITEMVAKRINQTLDRRRRTS